MFDATDPDDIKPETLAKRRNPLGQGQSCVPLDLAPTLALLQAQGKAHGGDDLPVPSQPSTGRSTDDDLKGLIGH